MRRHLLWALSMRKKAIPVMLLGLFLSGCAIYQPNNFFSGGYSEVQLAPDVFSISFEGASWSGAAVAHDFAMLRGADVTVKNGFRYFAVFTARDRASISSVRTPGRISTNDYVSGEAFYGPSTFIPAQKLNIAHPRSRLVIKCFTSKPRNILALDARLLRHSIRKAYNLPPLQREAAEENRRRAVVVEST